MRRYSKPDPRARQIYWKWVGGMSLFCVLISPHRRIVVTNLAQLRRTVPTGNRRQQISAILGSAAQSARTDRVQTPIAFRATTSR